MASLEQDFHHAMVAIYERERDYGYYATYFKRMLDEHGGVQAAKRLLASNEAQAGLFKLWELGHLENSVEAHVIKDKYRPLFSEAELQEASWRLSELGYPLARQSADR